MELNGVQTGRCAHTVEMREQRRSAVEQGGRSRQQIPGVSRWIDLQSQAAVQEIGAWRITIEELAIVDWPGIDILSIQGGPMRGRVKFVRPDQRAASGIIHIVPKNIAG